MIRIGGAFALGTAFVAGALLYAPETSSSPAEQSNSALAFDAPTRTYIPPEDSDENGVSDWKESFGDSPSDTMTKIVSLGSTTIGDTEDDNTLTNAVSKDLFEQYIYASLTGRLTENTQDSFVGSVLSSVKARPAEKTYGGNDILLRDNSVVALREYGNALARAVFEHSTAADPVAPTLEEAFRSKNAEVLKKLQPRLTGYQNIIDATLRIPAPQKLKEEHAALINAYSEVRNDIEIFMDALDDPLLAFAQIRAYQEHAEALRSRLEQIYFTLYEEGVYYTDDEPAAVFQMQMNISP